MSGYSNLQNTLGWIGMKENAYIRVLKIILLLEVIFPSLNMTNPITDFFRSKSILIWKMPEHCIFWKRCLIERRSQRGGVFLILLIPLAPLYVTWTLEKVCAGKCLLWLASTIDVMAVSGYQKWTKVQLTAYFKSVTFYIALIWTPAES